MTGAFMVRSYEGVREALKDGRLLHWTARDGRGSPFRQSLDRWLDAMDPRNDSQVRATLCDLLSPAATQARVRQMSDLADDLCNAALRHSPLNVRRHYAAPFVRANVLGVLGISPERAHAYGALVESLCEAIPKAIFSSNAPEDEALQSWRALVDDPSSARPGGLLARLPFDADRAAFAAMFVYAAAANITELIVRGICRMASHGELWERIATEPTTLSEVIEELLRCECPVTHVYLVAREPIDADGELIATGDSVVACLREANTDPARFPREDRFEPHSSNPHLSFGTGPLACIGAGFARVQAAVAIGTLARLYTFEETERTEYPFACFRRREA